MAFAGPTQRGPRARHTCRVTPFRKRRCAEPHGNRGGREIGVDSAHLPLRHVHDETRCMRASESHSSHGRSLQGVATPPRTHTSVSSYTKSGRPTQQDFAIVPWIMGEFDRRALLGRLKVSGTPALAAAVTTGAQPARQSTHPYFRISYTRILQPALKRRIPVGYRVSFSRS